MTQFSYQLYSSRNFPPLEAVLDRLAALGVETVEGYGGLYPTVADARDLAAALVKAGLKMRSGHMGLDLVEERPDEAVEIAGFLGLEQVFVPYLQAPDRPSDADDWRAFGARLVSAGAPIRAAGLTYGWHNHDFEYMPLPTGELPIDLILDGNDLSLEFDVAWSFVAGKDPMETIQRYGSRIAAAHVKDRAPDGEKGDEDGWADLGDGRVDWPGCLTALKAAGCKNFVLEHDNPSDDQRFASRSLAYLHSLEG